MGFLRFKSEAVKAKVNLHVPVIGSVAAVEQTFRVERGDVRRSRVVHVAHF